MYPRWPSVVWLSRNSPKSSLGSNPLRSPWKRKPTPLPRPRWTRMKCTRNMRSGWTSPRGVGCCCRWSHTSSRYTQYRTLLMQTEYQLILTIPAYDSPFRYYLFPDTNFSILTFRYSPYPTLLHAMLCSCRRCYVPYRSWLHWVGKNSRRTPGRVVRRSMWSVQGCSPSPCRTKYSCRRRRE